MNMFTSLKNCCFLFLISIFLCLITAANIRAQDATVSIKIINAKKEPLPFASLTVAAVKDSTQVFNKVSDSSGVAVFALQYQQYIVNVSSVNYALFQRGITV